jgi:hypothetical protein
MVIGSVGVCIMSVLWELSASFAYYKRAFKMRYVGVKKSLKQTKDKSLKGRVMFVVASVLSKVGIRPKSLEKYKPPKPQPTATPPGSGSTRSLGRPDSMGSPMSRRSVSSPDGLSVATSGDDAIEEDDAMYAPDGSRRAVDERGFIVLTPRELAERRQKMIEKAVKLQAAVR